MALTIELNPELERTLAARAEAKGVSLEDFVLEVLSREAIEASVPSGRSGRELVLLCARVRGLADDLDLQRDSSLARDIDLT